MAKSILVLAIIVSTAVFANPIVHSKENPFINKTELSCENRSCRYSATVTNNGNEAFSGFFHIYGYDKKNDKLSLVAEKYKHINVDPGETILVTQEFHFASRPEQLEYSLRRNEYSGWLGSCDDGIYNFDLKNMRYTMYEQIRYQDRAWEYKIHEGVLSKRLGNQFEVILEDKKYNYLINFNPKDFRIEAHFPLENRGGYFKACDIVKVKQIIRNAIEYKSKI